MKNRKEYNNRWDSKLVNEPITYGDIIKRRIDQLETLVLTSITNEMMYRLEIAKLKSILNKE